MLEQRIQQQFIDSADLNYASAELLSRPIAEAAAALVAGLTGGAKVLVCGDGASAGAAQAFAAQLAGRFERERPGLAAMALSADATLAAVLGEAHGQPAILARQVEAFGAPGDLLVALSPGGDSAAVLAAVAAARARELTVVALTGQQGGRADAALRRLLGETDVLIGVPHDRAARVRETHLLVLHCLADAVDYQLLGEPEAS